MLVNLNTYSILEAVFILQIKGGLPQNEDKFENNYHIYIPCIVIIVSWFLFEEKQQLVTMWVEFKCFCCFSEATFTFQIEGAILQNKDKKL